MAAHFLSFYKIDFFDSTNYKNNKCMWCVSWLQSDTYQEDIYPMTAGTEPALSASEWLSGINRGRKHTRSIDLCLIKIK